MKILPENPDACQVGWYVNRETGELVPARCKCWRCRYCGPRRARAFARRAATLPVTYFVTLTYAGAHREIDAGLVKEFNAQWRNFKQWVLRHGGGKSATWVNEAGGNTGHLHKHAMIQMRRRLDYSSARSAIVRCGLGRVCDFQRVKSASAAAAVSVYVSKYLAKNLANRAWPRRARRCQTSAPKPKADGTWTFSRIPHWKRETEHRRLIHESEAALLRRADALLERDEQARVGEQGVLALILNGKTASEGIRYGPD